MTARPAWPNRFDVASAKLTAYLLNPAHRDGGSKGQLLAAFGFTRADPAILAAALHAHAQRGNFRRPVPAPLAVKLHFEGRLSAPVGPGPLVRTVWQMDDADASRTARFITLRPLPRP